MKTQIFTKDKYLRMIYSDMNNITSYTESERYDI